MSLIKEIFCSSHKKGERNLSPGANRQRASVEDMGDEAPLEGLDLDPSTRASLSGARQENAKGEFGDLNNNVTSPASDDVTGKPAFSNGSKDQIAQ